MAKVKWLNESCHLCGKRLNSWDQRICKALGYRRTICEGCVAKEYGQDVDELRATLEDFFGMRPCQGL